MRILPVESLRFPEEGSSAQGKSGPKPRLKSVGDGQRVENPVPPRSVKRGPRTACWVGVLTEGETQEVQLSVRLEEHVQSAMQVR